MTEYPPSHTVHHATRNQRIALFAGLAVVLWFALQLFESILLPFVAASVLAYVLHPFSKRLGRVGMSSGGAAALVVIGVILALLLFVLLLYPVVLGQAVLLIGRVPGYATNVSAFAARSMAQLQQHLGPAYVNSKISDLVSSQAGAVLSFIANATTRVVGSGFAIFNVASLLVVTPVVTFYLLRDWDYVITSLDSWLPFRYRDIIRAQAREVDRILSAWVRGQAVCCMLLALYYAMALSLVGLDLGLVVGLAAGALSFIPYVGSITGLVVSIGLAFDQFPTWAGIVRVLCVFVVGQVLEGYVIYPRFLGDRVELPAVWVIFALFAGGAAFGFLGVMLAVPVAATVGVLSRFWLRRYLLSPLYLDPPTED